MLVIILLLFNSSSFFSTSFAETLSEVCPPNIKPIKPKLLVSKVKALLRRLKNDEHTSETLNVGGIEINREEYKIIKDNKAIVLPRKEFELFYLLASKPGKVFKREEILDKVWGNEVIVGGRTIDVHIRKLREKIGDDLFKTIKGVGYKLEV